MKMRVLLAFVAMLIALPAAGQSCKPPDCVVMSGSKLTESALIDALIPPPATLRNFGPRQGGKAAAKPKAAQASLLIEFETNSTDLTADAKQQLDVVGRALNNNKLADFSFVLEGHADPRGTAEWNQHLSEGRADSVRQYLVATHNVSADRLKAIGKGDREPLNVKNPAAPENRRVTILTVEN